MCRTFQNCIAKVEGISTETRFRRIDVSSIHHFGVAALALSVIWNIFFKSDLLKCIWLLLEQNWVLFQENSEQNTGLSRKRYSEFCTIYRVLQSSFGAEVYVKWIHMKILRQPCYLMITMLLLNIWFASYVVVKTVSFYNEKSLR